MWNNLWYLKLCCCLFHSCIKLVTRKTKQKLSNVRTHLHCILHFLSSAFKDSWFLEYIGHAVLNITTGYNSYKLSLLLFNWYISSKNVIYTLYPPQKKGLSQNDGLNMWDIHSWLWPYVQLAAVRGEWLVMMGRLERSVGPEGLGQTLTITYGLLSLEEKPLNQMVIEANKLALVIWPLY